MGFDRQGSVVIRVWRASHGLWEVTESGCNAPLATFEDRQHACDFANRLTMARDGAAVLVLDEGSLRAPSVEKEAD